MLERPEHGQSNNWLQLQENLLELLKAGKTDALRQQIFAAGRDYPRSELVTELLRPLRSKFSARLPAMMMLREILDGIIIGYTTFCLDKDRKSRGENYLICGWQLADSCEIWLEALKRSGGGCRLDVLPGIPDMLAPEVISARRWLLVTHGAPTQSMARQAGQWQQQGIMLEIITL